jgi:hypothetical protein
MDPEVIARLVAGFAPAAWRRREVLERDVVREPPARAARGAQPPRAGPKYRRTSHGSTASSTTVPVTYTRLSSVAEFDDAPGQPTHANPAAPAANASARMILPSTTSRATIHTPPPSQATRADPAGTSSRLGQHGLCPLATGRRKQPGRGPQQPGQYPRDPVDHVPSSATRRLPARLAADAR